MYRLLILLFLLFYFVTAILSILFELPYVYIKNGKKYGSISATPLVWSNLNIYQYFFPLFYYCINGYYYYFHSIQIFARKW